MEKSKKIVIAAFTTIVTFAAVYLNWPKFLKGNTATIFNLVVTSIYLLAWFIFSSYWGFKRESKYYKFMLIYWSTNLICFIILSLSTDIASLFLPLVIWFGSSIYGFAYFEQSYTTIFYIASGSIPILLNIIGYWAGVMISRIIRIKYDHD